MARDPIPTWYFAMVVVRKGDRFLVVQEAKHGQRWYLPAGRIEPGESLEEGAKRETLEESGIPIVLEGILRVEHSYHTNVGYRMRVFFLARPKDDTPPKSVPDEESLRAAWVTIPELQKLPLRGVEVQEIFIAVSEGCPVYPLTLFLPEGTPWG